MRWPLEYVEQIRVENLKPGVYTYLEEETKLLFIYPRGDFISVGWIWLDGKPGHHLLVCRQPLCVLGSLGCPEWHGFLWNGFMWDKEPTGYPG